MASSVKRILVATDFSPAAEAALQMAIELAGAIGASVEVLHVVDLPSVHGIASEGYVPLPEAYRADVERQARERLNASIAGLEPRPQTVLREGKPKAEIVQYAREREIDLIAMGTRGRGGLPHLLMGSVAEHVVRTAPCPVLTVRDSHAGAHDAASSKE